MEWTLVALQGVLLLAGLAAFLSVLRRVGLTSVYGHLFFTNCLGLWVLFVAFLVLNYHGLVLGSDRTVLHVGHFVKLLAYLFIALSFIMLASHFESGGPQSVRRLRGWLLLTPAVGAWALGVYILSPLKADAWHMMQLAYLTLGGIGIGAVLYCFIVLAHLGNSLLARFYLLFGATVILNAVADFGAVHFAMQGHIAPNLAVETLYALAGVMLVGSAIYHARALAVLGKATEDLTLTPYEALGLTTEEKVLSAYVHLHRTLLGAAAHAQLQAAAWDAARDLRKPVRVEEVPGPRTRPGLTTNLSPEDFRHLLRGLRDRYHRLAGGNSAALGHRVALAYGREFEFLAR